MWSWIHPPSGTGVTGSGKDIGQGDPGGADGLAGAAEAAVHQSDSVSLVVPCSTQDRMEQQAGKQPARTRLGAGEAVDAPGMFDHDGRL